MSTEPFGQVGMGGVDVQASMDDQIALAGLDGLDGQTELAGVAGLAVQAEHPSIAEDHLLMDAVKTG